MNKKPLRLIKVSDIISSNWKVFSLNEQEQVMRELRRKRRRKREEEEEGRHKT